MAHITPPEPAIDLYETGFDREIDLLDRAATAKSLSDLVMRIDDPLVIALDGGWGSGKSFFLKCWVGAHLKDHGDTSQTVYFDAFEHDFIDAPLASLMGVLAERLEPAEGAEKKSGKTVAKATLTAFRKAALPLTRLGLAVATYGATEAAGAMADTFINQASKEFEKAAEDFWTRESGQRAAMAQFKDVLKSVTESEDSPKKLIIVIDELDRCRPDYALSLLEIIKHFFAVPNVHFVLGVNMTQLENSVHARYGAGIDAGLYLQKFVGLTMRLPTAKSDHASQDFVIDYFTKISASTGLNKEVVTAGWHLLTEFEPREAERLSLRAVQRFVSVLLTSTAPRLSDYSDERRNHLIVVTLALFKALAPNLYSKATAGTLSLEDMKDVFGFFSDPPEAQDRFQGALYDSWLFYLEPERLAKQHPDHLGRVTVSKSERMRNLRRLIRSHLETFTLPPANP